MNLRTKKYNLLLFLITCLFLLTSACTLRNKNSKYDYKADIIKIDSLIEQAEDSIQINIDFSDSLAFEVLENSMLIDYKRGIAEANRILGYICIEKGDYKQSFELLQTSLSTGEQIHFEEGIARTYNNLGILFNALQLRDEALEYYASAASTDYIKTDSALWAIVNVNIANIKFMQKKYDEASEYYSESLKIFEKLRDTSSIIAAYINLGDTEAKKDPPDRPLAFEYFKKSKTLAELQNKTLFKMYSLKYIGMLLISDHKYDEALPYLQEAYSLAKNLSRPKDIKQISEQLKKYFIYKNDAEEALKFQLVIEDIENHLEEDETINLINRELLIQQKEIYDLKIKNQKRLISVGLILLIITVLLLMTLYASYKHKQKANRLLTEMDELKSRMFSEISHELRTPLTLILAPLEQMLSKEAEKAPSRKQIKMMRKNANSILGLINQILDLSKIDAKSMKLELTEMDIVSFMRAHFAAFASLAGKKHISFNSYTPPDKKIRMFDAVKLEKIINNLVSNAIKYTPEGGQVFCFASFPQKNELELLVQDTGHGISADELPKIFDRFHRVEGLETNSNLGTGIGLTLTKELTELMYGRISAESVLGEGTKFKVLLPLGTEHLKNEEYVVLKEYSPEPNYTDDEDFTADCNKNEKRAPEESEAEILIVEDHTEISDFIRENLPHCYQVYTAPNGKIGLEMATQQIPDLIISDVMMPEMNGIAMSKKLKNDERTSHIPIILLTAKSSQADKMEGLESGIDAFLPKPFSMKELALRVNKLIEQRRKLRERFTKNLNLEPREIAVTSADEKFLTRVMDIIEKHMGNTEFEVGIMQDELFMSRTQLFRKIKALTNQSPGEFIRTVRLKRAAQLIDRNFGNIAQIAFEVGFNNPSYFAKCFKDLFGELPSEYIKKA